MFIHEALGEKCEYGLLLGRGGGSRPVLKLGPRLSWGIVVFSIVDCEMRDAAVGSQDRKVSG